MQPAMLKLNNFRSKFFKKRDNGCPLRLKYFQKIANAGEFFLLAVAKHYLTNNVIPLRFGLNQSDNLILHGSILHWADHHSIVCDAGYVKQDARLTEKPKMIHCERGSLTARLLEKQSAESLFLYADPGVLAPDILPDRKKPKYRFGIIPNYQGVNYISVLE